MNKSTVYVNNLQKDITEDKLEQLFKQVSPTLATPSPPPTDHTPSCMQSGEVKEVRIVRNLQGRPKGYAYVEFLEEVSEWPHFRDLYYNFEVS